MRPIKRILQLCLSFIIMLLSVNTFSNANAQLMPIIHHWRLQYHVPSVSVFISQHNDAAVIVDGGTEISGGSPVTSNTLYGVGSITKTFVSVIILKLEAEHQLKLSDPVTLYFPQYTKWRHVTIQELLNMTSGVPNDFEIPVIKKVLQRNPKAIWTQNQLIQLAYTQSMSFAAGTAWEYSNTNYLLLGKIIEKITRQPLEMTLEDMLFKPLKLQHTFYSDGYYPRNVMRDMAHGYHNGMDMTSVSQSSNGPAGGMFMSASDVGQWATDLLIHKNVLPQKELQQFLTGVPVPYTPMRPAHTQYGLGIFISKHTNVGNIIWYTGVIPGYSSVFVWVPQKDILVVAQINAWSDPHFNLLFPNEDLLESILHYLNITHK